MPTYACVLCERLHFKKDISLVDDIVLSSFASLSSGVDPASIGKNEQICKALAMPSSTKSYLHLFHLCIFVETRNWSLLQI